MISYFFFFNDTATTEIYTLSLHDALPISNLEDHREKVRCIWSWPPKPDGSLGFWRSRSEEHTSELQSQFHLVCRLLLEKKKNREQSIPSRRIVLPVSNYSDSCHASPAICD